RPITKRSDREHDRLDENDALRPFSYGWPQCGHTALPSRRFFWQCGHGTRLPFGRVTRWTINPITQVAGIQPRIVTSCAFSEFRAFASFMIQSAVKIQAPIEAAMARKYITQQAIPIPAIPVAAAAAAAASSALGELLTVGVVRCARAFAAARRKGSAGINRFIPGMLRAWRDPMSTQL